MKKLFSLLAMAAMVFTACQNDEGVKNPTLADEGIVNLSVGVPELATRVLDGDNQSGADSAYGAIDYANYTKFLESDYDVRFQLAVYEAGADVNAEPIYTATNYVDFASTTNFNDLRFVPGREYQFVLFADFVPQGTEVDFRYNTADLRNITAFEALNAMDETYDAYFYNKTIKVEAGKVNKLEAVLKRPFGKVRVLTTDLAFVEKYAVPAEGEVTFYNHAIYKSFNAVTGEVTTEANNAEETLRYAIDTDYYGATQYEGKNATTLFATYILGKNAQEAVNFRLDTFEADGSLIKSLDFNTEIPYQRNHLTTLVGNLLTNEADFFVRIDDNFDAEHFEKGDFENVENGLKWVRQGELVGGQVYKYETNLFSFRLLSETDGTDLREGRYDYTEELPYIQNATGFDIQGIDVEKGSLEIIKRGTRAGNFYDVVFDIYATIDGKTENYILTWNGELKGAREPLAEPVVTYEVDEVDALHITFSWEAVENAADYTVEWNGEKETVEGTSATFDFSGEDTYATAYVTANPANADDYTATKGSVTVDWKKPIDYQPIAIELAGIDEKDGAHFYSIMEGLDLTISVPKYPKLEGAWYQVAGYLPTPFSAEAVLEETVGSAAGVVIYEPNADVDKEFDGPEAYAFTYEGAMNPYILTKAEVNWVAGYNTVKVKFSNDAGDAIEFQTTAPMEAGHATIEPTYVAIGGDEAANIEDAEMNVLLENGEYTIFFTIHSAINDVLMQYVGAIDFEKPYAPQYVLESYTANAETIYFEGENAKFEIEATSLESGDVVVKMLSLDGSDDYAAMGQVKAATADVTEENGIYDARYTVTITRTLPVVGETDTTFDLQYVGPFVPYSAEEPEQVNEFQATYENVEGLAVFTGIEYDYKIFVNNLATVEYDGTQADGWGARSLERPFGEGFYNFKNGDKLTVDGDNVTLEFVGWNGSKMRMLASTAPATQEPQEITVELAYEKNLYVGGNYQIDYQKTGTVVYVTNHNINGYPAMIDAGVTVYDDADELSFEFVDTFNNANVTAIYTKNVVAPATDIEVYLTLEGEIYKGIYETTTYSLSELNNGVAVLQIAYADSVVSGLTANFTENEQLITFTFFDEKNNVNVTAYYQKANAPAEPEYITLTTFNNTNQKNDTADGWQYEFSTEDRAYRGNLFINNGKGTFELIEGVYTWYAYGAGGTLTKPYFMLQGYRANNTLSPIVEASMEVKGNFVYLTINGINLKAEIATDEPDQPGTDEPEQPTTYEEVTLPATYETFIGSVKAYHAEPYWINGDTWMEVEGTPSLTSIKQEEKLESTETNGNVTTFKFTDEVNKKKVTVTYTKQTEEPEGPVVYDPWVFTASLNKGSKVLTMTDGTNTVVAQLNQLSAGTFYINDNGTLNATINGEASGTIKIDGDTYKVTIDATIDGVKYKGTSTNSAI